MGAPGATEEFRPETSEVEKVSMDFVAYIKELKNFRKNGKPEEGKGAEWDSPYDTLRKRWEAVPKTETEVSSTKGLLALSDEKLLAEWEKARRDITTGEQFAHRGWYHALYAGGMSGKKVMDVGSGFAVDSITFAQHGARLTFVDLVETNLKVLQRLCQILGLGDTKFVLFEDLASLTPLDTDYDLIMAMGSLHNAPEHVMQPEYQELVKHLKVGGRWLQLAYPRSRWVREGRMPFSEWGKHTDPGATPWCEWYDLAKLLRMLAPAKFDVVLYQEFHNGDFNWFDLLYRGK
jgi:2-polyprenyl-3-methyl-5-hydroxy-6-metoxy-1,4-benzoquinol methylase